MIESTENRTRDIPVWLTALILLLCIGGGGYLIWWYVTDRPPQVMAVPDADKFAPAKWKGLLAGGQRPPRDQSFTPADGIQRANKSARAKVGNTVLLISNLQATTPSFSLSYFTSVQTPEQSEMWMLSRSALTDPTWREYLKVTEEQLNALRNMPKMPQNMVSEPADAVRLAPLWKACNNVPTDKAADRAAAEKALLAALDEIGKKNLEPTKAYEASRADVVRKALTPEQIKLFHDAPGNRAPTTQKSATTLPTTKPQK